MSTKGHTRSGDASAPGGPDDNEQVDHEHGDIDVRAVLMFGVGLIVVTVACQLFIWGLFVVFERQAAANDPQVSPLALPEGRLPPEPQLQRDEPAGLATFHAGETKRLEGYGWVNQEMGVAHMPIAEAKKLLVERGLPVRPGAPLDPRTGTRASAMGEASAGRNIPVK